MAAGTLPRCVWTANRPTVRPLWLRRGGQQCEVVFDGVLYNRDELSQQIGGNLRPDDSDADILLEAYLRWGEETLLRRIKGIFGFCIWDGRSDLLLAVRDPIGIHPLFVARPQRSFCCPTPLLPWWPTRTCQARSTGRPLADHLRHRWVFPEETYYTAVTRVPPAHVLRLERRSGRREVRRYWDPPPLDKKVAWVGEDELDQFDTLFDEAVNRCLRMGPSGIYLSGGLDSVSVAAVAADNCRRQNMPTLRALSLVFPGTNEDGMNEEDVQRQVAASLGLPQDLVPFSDAVGEQGLLPPALEMSSSLAAPMLNMWNPAYRHLSARANRHGCRVILTGGGGDEWLTVSPFYALTWFAPLTLPACTA
jgi:asparagine synthetase B (glutamine-hydrolysing)